MMADEDKNQNLLLCENFYRIEDKIVCEFSLFIWKQKWSLLAFLKLNSWDWIRKYCKIGEIHENPENRRMGHGDGAEKAACARQWCSELIISE